MKTGIIDLSLVAVRKDPDDKSEMINQLLFGELTTILETSGKWTKIRSEWDDYEGWIDSKQWLSINEKEFQNLKNTQPVLSGQPVSKIHSPDGDIVIVLGSCLPNIQNNIISFDTKQYNIDNQIYSKYNSTEISSIYKLYLNAPYLWGGRSIFGIDCSGFTQMVFKFQNIRLKRDTQQQAEQGTSVSSISKAQKGDLLFFKNKEQKICHAGIYLGENKIVHASGKVRIDKVDDTGIFRASEKKYSHSIHSIKRFEGVRL